MPKRTQAARGLHRRIGSLALAVALGTVGGKAAEEEPGRWLAVTAPAFRSELTPLIEHRRAEGFHVTIVESTSLLTSEQIRQTNSTPLQTHIREFCLQTDSPCYVLLVGTAALVDPANAERTVVPALLGTVERMKGQLSDYRFAPPMGPASPMVTVGRFPARSAEEVRVMVQKTLRLEQAPPTGDWRNRLVLLLGNPGGGAVAEMVADATLMRRLPRLHPSWNVQAISCSAASRYFLPGKNARDAFLRALEDGGLFSVFMGHSSPSAMWLSGNHHVTRADWSQLSVPSPGIFFTCGCFALQPQAAGGDGYGLAAMRQSNGPTAVIGATAESYAAPGLLAADGLLQCFGQPPFPSRLGDFWRSVQAGLATGEIDRITFTLYDQADGSKGKVPLEVQRLEHLEMWMLLGDPALHLPLTPVDVSLEPAGMINAGESFTVRGVLTEDMAGATVRVTLERPLASAPIDLEPLPADNPENAAARERIVADNHRRANSFVLATAAAQANGNAFHCTLIAPDRLPWSSLLIRAEASAAGRPALGIVSVPVSVVASTE